MYIMYILHMHHSLNKTVEKTSGEQPGKVEYAKVLDDTKELLLIMADMIRALSYRQTQPSASVSIEVRIK